MKHRILFVDDDAAALRRVATMLRGQSEDWEFIFAQSGNAALVELANQPCEVVFADLHMPGMSGAELLQEVRMCYPRTVRFLLASAADTEFITRSGGDVHQFLAKPCEEAALKGEDFNPSVLDSDQLSSIGTSAVRTVTAFDNLQLLPRPVPLAVLRELGCGTATQLLTSRRLTDRQLQGILLEGLK